MLRNLSGAVYKIAIMSLMSLSRLMRRWLLGYSGGGVVSFRARVEGSRSNIVVEEGAFVCEHAWLVISSDRGALRVGGGTSIRPYAQLLADGGFVKIGRGCTVNSFCILNGAGGLTIGDYVMIGAQTTIIAGNHSFDDPSRSIHDQDAEGTREGIVIADDVWMGYGVRIMDGVRVGAHSVLAAGAVITRDVPENAIVAGVPGKVLRMRGEGRS